MNNRDLHPKPPTVFLAGPPGSGKSTLGARACKGLGLKFLDFSDPESPPADPDDERKALEAVIIHRTADVVALSWPLQQSDDVLKLVQCFGEVLLLWAHPEDMQARSGYQEPLFTPTGQPEIRGGFGERGIDCSEFRRLARAADERALLVDMVFDKAVEEVNTWIQIAIDEYCYATDVIEGIHQWAVDWQAELDADKKAARMTTGAMALYTSELRRRGATEDEMAGVYDDLRAAGSLVFEHDGPEGEGDDVLECFKEPPWVEEFRRKFSDSEDLVARYRKNLEGFWRYLRKVGLVGKKEE